MKKNHSNLRLTNCGAFITAVTATFPSNKWTVNNTPLMCGITKTATPNGRGQHFYWVKNHQLEAWFQHNQEVLHLECKLVVQSLGWMLFLMRVDRNKVINPKTKYIILLQLNCAGSWYSSAAARLLHQLDIAGAKRQQLRAFSFGSLGRNKMPRRNVLS